MWFADSFLYKFTISNHVEGSVVRFSMSFVTGETSDHAEEAVRYRWSMKMYFTNKFCSYLFWFESRMATFVLRESKIDFDITLKKENMCEEKFAVSIFDASSRRNIQWIILSLIEQRNRQFLPGLTDNRIDRIFKGKRKRNGISNLGLF